MVDENHFSEIDNEVQNLKSIIKTISDEIHKQFPNDVISNLQTIARKDFARELKLRNR